MEYTYYRWLSDASHDTIGIIRLENGMTPNKAQFVTRDGEWAHTDLLVRLALGREEGHHARQIDHHEARDLLQQWVSRGKVSSWPLDWEQ